MAEELLCPVEQVCFYEDRAEVRRRGRVVLQAGPQALRLAGLSPVLVDSSLRVQVEGVTVSSLRLGRARANEDNGNFFAPRHELELSRRRGESLSNLCRRSEQGMQHWLHSDMLAQGGARDWLEGFAQQLEDHLGWLGEASEHDQLTERLRRELEAEEEQQRVRQLQVRAHVEFLVDGPGGEVEIEVSYQCGCALWRPEYAAEVREDRLELALYAVIWQNSGENWEKVRCSLATARPSRLAKAPAPEARELKLQVRDPEAKDRVEAYAATQSTRLAQRQEHVLQLAPDDRGRALIWDVSEVLDLPSDDHPARVRLAETKLGCQLVQAAYPECSRDVHLKVSARHDGFARNWPLLAGPVRVRGNAQSLLSFCAPGQSFELSLGRDEQLNVWRETSSESDVVPITGTQRWTHEVKVWVQNLVDRPQRVWVRERIPVSELRHLRVELLEAGGHRADENGFVDRNVELEPYEIVCLRLTYRILAAAEVELSDRPRVVRSGLPPMQSLAVLLMSLPPEVGAPLFKELGADQVQAITLEISKLPPISPEMRVRVLEEFLHSIGVDGLGSAIDLLEHRARSEPARLAADLQRFYSLVR